ncbi:MAG: PorV/PorQ family protein [Ignavibacteriales bacterium]|nr:PorV/PorQ family protein [Ignavibacteriales bacterium]
MKKALFIVLLIVPTVLLGQGTSRGSTYLKIPSSARIGATAEATIADPGSFSSSFLNPANMAMSTRAEILLAHTEWIQGLQNELLSATLPVSYGIMGMALTSANIRDIEVREIPGPPVATFTARFATIQLLYGLQASEEFSLGVNFKYLYEKIYVDESSGYALDIGAVYSFLSERFSLGASVSNIGPGTRFRSVSSDLPSQFQFGGSYTITETDVDLLVSASFVHEFQATRSRMNFGSETHYGKTLFLRLGYQSGFESRSITGGVGFRYSFAKFDYAYLPFSLGLGNVHMLSLGFEL